MSEAACPRIIGVRLEVEDPDLKKELRKVLTVDHCLPEAIDAVCPGLCDTAIKAYREFNRAGTRVDNFILKGSDERILVAEDNSITMRRSSYKILDASEIF